MSRRKENVIKACNSIDAILQTQSIEPMAYGEIRRWLHSIKRTTWRGEEKIKDYHTDYNSVGINLPRSAYRNPDL